MQAKLLPLFPLQVVVFPRTQLPLHIFEERYKEMVADAIRDSSEFGIVLAKEEGILNAGCTVVVDKVLKSHPDGRMDILTRGIRRQAMSGPRRCGFIRTGWSSRSGLRRVRRRSLTRRSAFNWRRVFRIW